jgi:hypothetical protein
MPRRKLKENQNKFLAQRRRGAEELTLALSFAKERVTTMLYGLYS